MSGVVLVVVVVVVVGVVRRPVIEMGNITMYLPSRRLLV